ATTARSVITSVSVRERRMSGPSDVGLHGEQGAVVERDAGHWLAELVADTPGGAREQILAVQRETQAGRPHTACGATDREERAQLARRTRKACLPMDHGDAGVADERLDVEIGERRRREEERVGEEVVEPSAVA